MAQLEEKAATRIMKIDVANTRNANLNESIKTFRFVKKFDSLGDNSFVNPMLDIR